ncbi:hypothetical protein G7046_g4915 [Stylonectria norvegica]|nr:hypothetical protein G7046_g4915 [Stylonectria norvegica]
MGQARGREEEPAIFDATGECLSSNTSFGGEGVEKPSVSRVSCLRSRSVNKTAARGQIQKQKPQLGSLLTMLEAADEAGKVGESRLSFAWRPGSLRLEHFIRLGSMGSMSTTEPEHPEHPSGLAGTQASRHALCVPVCACDGGRANRSASLHVHAALQPAFQAAPLAAVRDLEQWTLAHRGTSPLYCTSDATGRDARGAYPGPPLPPDASASVLVELACMSWGVLPRPFGPHGLAEQSVMSVCVTSGLAAEGPSEQICRCPCPVSLGLCRLVGASKPLLLCPITAIGAIIIVPNRSSSVRPIPPSAVRQKLPRYRVAGPSGIYGSPPPSVSHCTCRQPAAKSLDCSRGPPSLYSLRRANHLLSMYAAPFEGHLWPRAVGESSMEADAEVEAEVEAEAYADPAEAYAGASSRSVKHKAKFPSARSLSNPSITSLTALSAM